MSDGQIVVSGLSKQYKTVRAVDDLSFQVEPGRVTGFLGPNGAGKTTTLRMLLNLVKPTAGTASANPRPSGSAKSTSRVALACSERSSIAYPPLRIQAAGFSRKSRARSLSNAICRLTRAIS